MIRKRYIVLTTLLLTAAVCAGCGKKADDQSAVEVTPTPAAQTDVTPTVTQALVQMETVDETNVMGEKTDTASKITIVNQTGSEVKALYIRQTPQTEEEEEADEWGDDLISGKFTLGNGDNAVYYYDKSGITGTCDIRITYTEEGKNECFFRNLPLTTISRITLRMDGTGEDSIPYATYMTTSGGSEASTLSEVKQRLGLDDEEDSLTPTPEADDTQEPTGTPAPTNAADPTSEPEPTDDPSGAMVDVAKTYIGDSLDDLESAIGSGDYSEYDQDEEQGTIGYHYYSNFTVYTTVDDSGNEVVSGVY